MKINIKKTFFIKKINILLITLFVGLNTLSACSTSNDEIQTIEENRNYLIGKWNAISTHTKIEMDGEVILDNLNNEEGSMYGSTLQYEFKADNTINYYVYTPASGDNESIERKGTTTYERKGNQLILKDYYPGKYTILISEENKLHLYNIFEVESEGSYIKTESIDKLEKMN